MSETSLPPAPTWTPATPPPPPAAPPAAAARPRVPFHQRIVRIWWAIGVALACLVVGAGTGSLITHLAEGGSTPARQLPGGFGPNGFTGGQGFRGPNGFRGQLQPGQGLPGQGQQLPGQTAPNVVPPHNGA